MGKNICYQGKKQNKNHENGINKTIKNKETVSMSGAASCAEYRRAKGVNWDVVRKEGEGKERERETEGQKGKED